ncbi:MAG: isochorismatase family protein [Cyclobacteriaceae bacterium]
MPFRKEKGFSESLPFGRRPALIVIDMLKAYTLEHSYLYAESYIPVLEKGREMLALAREKGLSVCFTNLHYDENHYTGGWFLEKIPALKLLTKYPEFAEMAEGFEPRPEEPVFTKQYASSFFGTSLLAFLNFKGCDSLLITGVSTSGCVRATATDAIQHGLIPMLVSDAVGDRDPKVHEANLFDLQAKYADIYTLDEVKENLDKL